MLQDTGCENTEIDGFKCLLLDMARQRSVNSLLRLVVERLSRRDDVALARVWLLNDQRAGSTGQAVAADGTDSEQPDRSEVRLELAASAGDPPAHECEDPGATPVPDAGANGKAAPAAGHSGQGGLVGRIAASGEHVELTVLDPAAEGICDPAWAVREQIRGLIGHPLTWQGRLLGVLLVVLREPPAEDVVTWLRMIADHMAAAITTARAFEEIGQLQNRLEQENEYLRDEVRAARDFGEIIGESSAIARVLDQVELVAPTNTSVLILGESGVGKELIARAIHSRSKRAEHPLITVNCASIPRDLFESEFFGHIQGAFTGAVRDRAGRFELADGGTLFLDEVGEIPLEMQGKLLRVLQEGTWERIGEEQTRTADVRLVAATNRNLEAEVAAGRFRQDLYYRLSVFPIEVAPLRQRKEDIPPLALHFLRLHSERLGLPVPVLRKRHIERLQQYDWPGNIRELQNVVERAVIRSRVGPLQFDLPLTEETLENGAAAGSPADVSPAQLRMAGGMPQVADDDLPELLTDAEVRQFERSNLEAVLKRHGWKISGRGGAAEFLGLHPATLSSRLRSLSIRRPQSD